MYKHYPIRLTDAERREIEQLLESGRQPAREITRARILLLADKRKRDREIAETLKISSYTVHNVRKRFFNNRSINSLEEKPRPGKPPKFTGITAMRIGTLVCSQPPEGHKRWTLRLLADRAVELELVDTISHESIRRILLERKRDREVFL